jgi:hypothetical protein
VGFGKEPSDGESMEFVAAVSTLDMDFRKRDNHRTAASCLRFETEVGRHF